MESKQKRTALVTGGSSGIGRCTAVALSKAGYIVYEFSRRDVPVEGVKHMCVDVIDEASWPAAGGPRRGARGRRRRPGAACSPASAYKSAR